MFLGAYELTSDQIADLIGRNPSLGQMVTETETDAPETMRHGISFTDSVYGTVLISIDARGYVRYIADSPVDPDTINKEINDPSGGAGGFFSPSDWLQSLEDAAKTYGTMAMVGLAVYAYLTRRK